MTGARRPEAPHAEPPTERARRQYARPRVIWREPYAPTSFGISCAKQPGNPGCNPGPSSG